MKGEYKMKNRSKKTAITLICFLLTAASLTACGDKDKSSTSGSKETSAAVTEAVTEAPTETPAEEVPAETEKLNETDPDIMLSLWNNGAAAKKELASYMESITDPASSDFIPEEDRIAVFDLDGTLFCETDPNYFDYTLLKYRVLEDENYKDKASDFEREVAEKIKKQNETGESFEGLEVDHGKAVASAFSLPVREECADVVISCFAPVSNDEYARVLKKGGHLLIASPTENHLLGLKNVLYDKPYLNEPNVYALNKFSLVETHKLEYKGELTSSEQIMALFTMTPYYFKTPAEAVERLRSLSRLETDIGFEIRDYIKQ